MPESEHSDTSSESDDSSDSTDKESDQSIEKDNDETENKFLLADETSYGYTRSRTTQSNLYGCHTNI